MKLWEILAEMTGQGEAIVVVPLVEASEAEEDLLLAKAEASIEVETEETDQCTKPFAATAEKSVRCLLGLQTANLFTAVTALRK